MLSSRMAEVTSPFYVVHAGGDTVTSPKISEKFFNLASSKDKEIKIWPGARHADVFHGGAGYSLEVQKGGYDGVADWITARL